jgi:hypothetical protein
VRDRLATPAIRQFKLVRNIDRSDFENQAEISMMLETALGAKAIAHEPAPNYVPREQGPLL